MNKPTPTIIKNIQLLIMEGIKSARAIPIPTPMKIKP